MEAVWWNKQMLLIHLWKKYGGHLCNQEFKLCINRMKNALNDNFQGNINTCAFMIASLTLKVNAEQ